MSECTHVCMCVCASESSKLDALVPAASLPACMPACLTRGGGNIIREGEMM